MLGSLCSLQPCTKTVVRAHGDHVVLPYGRQEQPWTWSEQMVCAPAPPQIATAASVSGCRRIPVVQNAAWPLQYRCRCCCPCNAVRCPCSLRLSLICNSNCGDMTLHNQQADSTQDPLHEDVRGFQEVYSTVAAEAVQAAWWSMELHARILLYLLGCWLFEACRTRGFLQDASYVCGKREKSAPGLRIA